MSVSTRRVSLGVLLLAATLPAAGQSIDSAISGANLGPGYAQLLNLTSAPDISTAHYKVRTEPDDLYIQVGRLTHEERWRALSENVDLFWRGGGGYSRMRAKFPTGTPSTGAGLVDSTWWAVGLTAGLLAKVRLDDEFTLLPAFDVGVARLENHTKYSGSATSLQPFLDGRLFGWGADATLLTPNIGLEWLRKHDDRVTTVRLHAAWSRIATYGEADPALKFREGGGVMSIRGEHVAPTTLRVMERPLRWVVFGGHSSFFGPNRAVLGFPSVSEFGLGLELPLMAGDAASKRVRFAGSYLVGPNVHGWSVALSMQY
jgi:hypothetical protein